MVGWSKASQEKEGKLSPVIPARVCNIFAFVGLWSWSWMVKSFATYITTTNMDPEAKRLKWSVILLCGFFLFAEVVTWQYSIQSDRLRSSLASSSTPPVITWDNKSFIGFKNFRFFQQQFAQCTYPL